MTFELPPTNWLRAFEASARLGGFSAAARELGVTPSAISQQIRLLEARLGVPLFVRTGRVVTLTQTGQAYLPVLTGSFARIEKRTRELFATKPQRVLRLRADTSFAMMWLPRRLPRLRSHAPRIELHVQATTWPTAENPTGEDCAIWFGATDRLPAGAEALTRETYIPVAAPPIAARITGPEDMIGHPLIHVLADPTGWRDWFEAAGLEPFQSDKGPRFDASGCVLEMAAHGGGFALAKRTLAQDYIDDGRLVRLAGPVLERDEGFCFLAQRHGAADIQCFRDWLRSELAADTA